MADLFDRFPEQSEKDLFDRFPEGQAVDIPTPEDDRGALERASAGLSKGAKVNTLMLMNYQDRLGRATEDDLSTINKLEGEIGTGQEGWVESMATGVGQFADLTRRVAPKALGTGLAVGAVGSLAATPAVGIPAGGTAAGVSFPAFMLMDGFKMGSGEAWSEIKRLNESEQLGMSKEQMGWIADITGIGIASLDLLGFSKATKPLKQPIKNALLKTVFKGMKNKGTLKAFLNGVKEGGIGWGVETLTEGIQQGLIEESKDVARNISSGGGEDIVANIAGAFQSAYTGGMPTDTPGVTERMVVPDAERFKEIGMAVVDEMKAAGKQTAGISFFGGSVNTVSRVAQARREKAAQRTLDTFKANGASNEEVAQIKKGMETKELAAIDDANVARETQVVEQPTITPENFKEAKQVQKQEQVIRQDTLIEKGESIKGDKKTISTKIGNAYRRGVADMRSNVASMFGTEIADQYDLAQPEQDKRVAVQQKREEIDSGISEIYGMKSDRAIKNLAQDDGYTITGKESGTIDLNKLKIIDIHNSLKNEHSREMYIKEFGQEQINGLMENMTQSDIAFADYLQGQVQSYREVLNQKNIEDTGEDLGVIENYWPRKSETFDEIISHYKTQSNIPSAQKARKTEGVVVPEPQDAYLATMRHAEQAEWVDKVSRKYDQSVRDFDSSKVSNMIKRKYGEGVHKSLMDTIERNSLQANNKQVDFGFNAFNHMINNWVVSNVAFNPTVIARQMGSVTNYAQHMNMGQWAVDFGKGLKSPKETFNYMWKNSEYLRERWKMGNSDATERALRDAKKLNSWWGNFNNVLTMGSRATDIGAQIYGGYPVVKEFEKTMSTKEAFKKFEKISRREQQSGLQANLSNVQSNPMARWLFAFKNTPMQYARLQADAVYRYQNGEITKKQLTKILTLVGVVQPIMYSLMGGLVTAAFKAAGGEDEEQLIKDLGLDIAANVMSSPFNFIPMVEGAAKSASRKALGKKTYSPLSVPLYDDFNTALNKINKNEKTMEDWFVITSMLQEPVFPLPTGTAKRYYDYFADDKKKSNTTF